jgi:hypothetical protein
MNVGAMQDLHAGAMFGQVAEKALSSTEGNQINR